MAAPWTDNQESQGAATACFTFAGADEDGDGFLDCAEEYLGTGPAKPCGSNGWPADLAGNDNTLNIGDFNSFLFPLRGDGSFNKFGHAIQGSADSNLRRWNLLVDATINIGDINALNPGVLAPTSHPPHVRWTARLLHEWRTVSLAALS